MQVRLCARAILASSLGASENPTHCKIRRGSAGRPGIGLASSHRRSSPDWVAARGAIRNRGCSHGGSSFADVGNRLLAGAECQRKPRSGRTDCGAAFLRCRRRRCSPRCAVFHGAVWHRPMARHRPALGSGDLVHALPRKGTATARATKVISRAVFRSLPTEERGGGRNAIANENHQHAIHAE